LEHARREAGAIDQDEQLTWRCPLESEGFKEYRDRAGLRALCIDKLSAREMSDFWPSRGPVWDGLAITQRANRILLEAKAHIPELLSPASAAKSAAAVDLIHASLQEARSFYAPRSKINWGAHFYQCCNRLAHQYFLAHVNGHQTKLVFLYVINVNEMNGPTTKNEWIGATKLVHALLGLPESLEKFNVFHAFIDAHQIQSSL
jgi:hypothetical protein